MNAAALGVWRAMGKRTHIIDAQKRPPRTAQLAYGLPFAIADTLTMLFAYQIADRAHFGLAPRN
jgi:hypothetical protein